MKASKIILGSTMMLLMTYVALAQDIGYSPYNDTVTLFWNSGGMENETYITTDLSQIANADVGRFSWGHYSDCVLARRLLLNTTRLFCPDRESPFNGLAQSDNLTVWSFGDSHLFGLE